MLGSYLKLALRNLKRHRLYAMINVVGLSIGVGCFLIAVIYANHEFSYNRQHEKLDRVYRLIREVNDAEGTHYSIYTPAMATPLEDSIPEIERAVQILNREMWVYTDGRGYNVKTCIASPGMLDVFTFPLLAGDAEDLKRPATAFVTQSLARRLFGNEDPIGQTVSVNYKWVNGDFEVAGVLKDIPNESDPKLRFEFLTYTFPEGRHKEWVWSDWNWNVISTHVLVKPGTDIDALQRKVREFADLRGREAEHERYTYHLQSGLRMHLFTSRDYGQQGEGPTGEISRVYGVLAIGFLVLMLACLNYINLVTSQSDLRAREVGLRKVAGALRRHLATQFLGESVVLSSIAFVVALILSYVALPYMSDMLGANLDLTSVDLLLILSVPVVMIPIVGLLAGVYPALVLSGYEPIESMKTMGNRRSGMHLRRFLIILQFTASTALIIGTIVLNDQIMFVQNKDLGFERDRVVSLPFFLRQKDLWQQQAAIRAEIAGLPNVESAAASHHYPGATQADFRTVHVAGAPPEGHKIKWEGIDEHFLKTFDVELLHGRNISVNDRWGEGDNLGTNVLINEACARMIGWSPDKVSELTHERRWAGRFLVVGVVRDYHNQSLHGKVIPMVLYPANPAKVIYARLGPGDLLETIEALERVWERFLPERPFEYAFLNEKLDTQYRAERTQRTIFTFFSVLAIIVSCLGTLGLVTYSARRRRREMGIRKVLGASGRTVIYLLSQEFLVLVMAAFAVATPIAYVFCADWLNTFTYRIDLPLRAFLGGGLLTFILVALSIAGQTVCTSREDPVEALRCE